MAAPSFQDLYDTAKAELVLQRPELQVADGDISDMLLAAIAAVADRLTGYAAREFAKTFLDSAHGADLETLVDDHWGIQKKAAVKASGTVTLTRAAGGAAVTVNAGSIVATARDAGGAETRFLVRTTTSWALNSTSLDLTVDAEKAGPSGNVAAGTVTRAISGIPQGAGVNNAAAMAGGSDAEADDELRERVRSLGLTYRRATKAALEQGALTVASVKTVKAEEVVDGDGALVGLVNLYVADANGNSSTAMVDAVVAEIENWRAAGVPVSVIGGTQSLQSLTITVTDVRSGTDIAALADKIKLAVVARVAKLKVGEKLFGDAVIQTVLNVDPGILSCTVSPATVTPAAGQAIRTQTNLITVA